MRASWRTAQFSRPWAASCAPGVAVPPHPTPAAGRPVSDAFSRAPADEAALRAFWRVRASLQLYFANIPDAAVAPMSLRASAELNSMRPLASRSVRYNPTRSQPPSLRSPLRPRLLPLLAVFAARRSAAIGGRLRLPASRLVDTTTGPSANRCGKASVARCYQRKRPKNSDPPPVERLVYRRGRGAGSARGAASDGRAASATSAGSGCAVTGVT